ncbi:MAG: thioredoxin domain-containing protein [Candidatus Thermoplasmatota archaeon]|nr:thioredoxin domain-containing protein [Candidatus Thermoplasmatota archaeon]MBS3789720.1 thioredoxin domain-containing protein [Candidatus Thermoplasmatota archaeon]
MKINHLKDEKSRYLQQHADNPVDWYPWGEEAFDKAKEENKPIFLSIGYSSCHWCHVMERESFEDEEVAEMMNDVFVSIKVDKEERPDVDKVYMRMARALTGAGGWPLNIVMTPDKKPFFAATYIPKESSGGRTGLKDLTKNIDNLWKNEKNRLLSKADNIIDSIKEKSGSSRRGIDLSVLDDAYSNLKNNFDWENHGFGNAPKFPTPHNLLFLLKFWQRTGEEQALEMVEKTLEAMRKGGIYDHLGYGFHRYSTDPHWKLPHFEKMLYDQSMLVIAYYMAYDASGKKIFRDIAEETIEYVVRELKADSEGFYSSEDADAGGIEGGYYIWSEDEIDEALDEPEIFKYVFDIKKEGNYREESTGKNTGKNVLYIDEDLEDAAKQFGKDKEAVEEVLEEMKKTLFEKRMSRDSPGKDEKILTDWNSLMIAGLALASRILDDEEIHEEAENTLEFILDKLEKEGQLYHRYIEGEVRIEGMLDDYAFLIWALLEMYENNRKEGYMKKAEDLTEKMIAKFYDEGEGGFYFSFSEELPINKKESHDGSYPSGNSVALLTLVKLSSITSDDRYKDKAKEMIRSFGRNIRSSPGNHTMFLYSIESFINEYGEASLKNIQ